MHTPRERRRADGSHSWGSLPRGGGSPVPACVRLATSPSARQRRPCQMRSSSSHTCRSVSDPTALSTRYSWSCCVLPGKSGLPVSSSTKMQPARPHAHASERTQPRHRPLHTWPDQQGASVQEEQEGAGRARGLTKGPDVDWRAVRVAHQHLGGPVPARHNIPAPGQGKPGARVLAATGPAPRPHRATVTARCSPPTPPSSSARCGREAPARWVGGRFLTWCTGRPSRSPWQRAGQSQSRTA